MPLLASARDADLTANIVFHWRGLISLLLSFLVLQHMVSGSLGCPGCLLSAGCMHCCMLVSDWLLQKEGNSKRWLLRKWREIRTKYVESMSNHSWMASIDVETRCRGYLMTMAGFLCWWRYLAGCTGADVRLAGSICRSWSSIDVLESSRANRCLCKLDKPSFNPFQQVFTQLMELVR